jgi:PST family polysaccharide transporter
MSVARQTAWAFVGVGGQQIVRFIGVIVLARLLTPAEFGVMAAAQIVLALGQTFVDLGIGVGLLQAKSLDRRTERSAVTVVIASSAAIALVIAVFAAPFAAFIGIAEVRAVLPWLALTFLLQGATGPIVQLMFRESRFREVSLVQLFSNAAGYAAVSIVLAYLGWGYWSLVAGAVASAVLQFLMLFRLRPISPTLKPDWRGLRPIVGFGAGVLVGSILNTLARRSDNWVAGRFLGAASLGFYSRAYSLMDLANELPGVLMTRVLLPHFARHAHAEDRRKAALDQFYMSHVAAGALTLPAAAATVILAPEIVAILLGKGWEPAAPVLSVLGAGIYFRLSFKVSSTVVLAYGRSWRQAVQQAIYAIMVVAGSLYGMRYGLTGIAWAVLAALAWQFWAQTDLALRTIRGSWAALFKALVPVFVAGAAAAAGGIAGDLLLSEHASPWLRLIALGSAIALPYAGTLLLFHNSYQVRTLVRLFAAVFDSKPAQAPVER